MYVVNYYAENLVKCNNEITVKDINEKKMLIKWGLLLLLFTGLLYMFRITLKAGNIKLYRFND